MSQIMFETFKVKGLYFLKNQILASYCNNRKSTKIIINLGEMELILSHFLKVIHCLMHINILT